ncbi:hypothetical protein Aperf_G00000103679 [Anoplocephala perfoliata]
MPEEVKQANGAVNITHSTHRKSITGPMHRLIKRLSGIPSQRGVSEIPVKSRLSFQAWRRRKAMDCKKEEEAGNAHTEKGENFLKPLTVASSTQPNQRRDLKRGPLRAAPLAEAEEIIFTKAKRPKLIASAAKRFSAISSRPNRVTTRNRRRRATEILSSPKQTRRGRPSNTSGSQSAQPLNPDNSPSAVKIYRPRFSLSESESSVSSLSNNKVKLTELTRLRESKRESNGIEEMKSPLTSLSSVEMSPSSDVKRTTEMTRMAGKTLFNTNPHLGIEYLIRQGVLDRDPDQIAEFLSGKDLSRQAIGEYFGKLSDPLAKSVTEAFIKCLDLRQVELDVALRRLLKQIHPDGESQKIEFLLSVLTKCYIEQNMEKVAKQFHDPETINVLAYSIMLLHTTFYNQSARKYGKPMSKTEFINNNRGIDGGRDLSTPLLEGIYERVSEKEFTTLPDPVDRLRRVDDLFIGPLKPENFIQRQRRFVAWFSGLEVLEFTARKPIIYWPPSQIRYLFVFNDLLVITKPFGLNRISAVDELFSGGSRRMRSLDRIVNRIASPGPLSIELPGKSPADHSQSVKPQDVRKTRQYSTEVPSNGPFFVKQIIVLENVKVLNFECELYKFGVQLCDANSVLTSISLLSAQARKKFTDFLNLAIWESGEVKYFSGRSKSAPASPSFSASTATSICSTFF